jgi:hypothetical protein
LTDTQDQEKQGNESKPENQEVKARREQHEKRQRELESGFCEHKVYISLCPECSPLS